MSSDLFSNPSCASKRFLVGVARTIGGPPVSPPPSQIILQMGKPRAREGEGLGQVHKAISGLKPMTPHAFGVSPRRSILFSLGSALLSRPWGSRFIISWCLQVLPSELLRCDLSEMQIGPGCFPAPVPLEKSYALGKPFKVLWDPSSAITFPTRGVSSGCLVPPRPPAPALHMLFPLP